VTDQMSTRPVERATFDDGQPPTPNALSRALHVVDAGPLYFYRAAVVSVAATCFLAIAIALVVRPPGAMHRPQHYLILAGLLGLCLIAVLMVGAVARPAERRSAALDRLIAPQQRAAIWLAVAVWCPLLLIAAYYLALSTMPAHVVWIAFGYMDKRWITATYLAGALAPMPLLILSARVLAAGRDHPDSWRAWFRALAPAGRSAGEADATAALERDGVTPAASSSWWGNRYLGTAVSMLTAIGLAYYFYGPPWYLTKTPTRGVVGINMQEDVYLGGFQAMFKGHVPFIGPASLQYGPGSQLLSYFYMRHVSGFSVVGFRESWAMMEWVGATIFFIVMFLALGYGRGLAASLVSALVFPALKLMQFVPGHAYLGFYGWFSPLRYAGAFAVILLLPAAIRRSPSWRGLTGAAVLGVVWGAMSYVGQENLAAGAIGTFVVAAVLVFSGTAAWRSVWPALLAVGGGFLLSWLPALAYYASKGLLGRFLYLYFLITRAVAEGYSNTPFGGRRPSAAAYQENHPWALIFHGLPFLLAIMALLAVVQFRPFRIATQWSRQRVILVTVIVTTIVMYQGALLRSDLDHTSGTFLIFPALVVVTATVLPRALGARQRLALVVAGAAIVAVSVALVPAHAYKPSKVYGEAAAPYQDRQRMAAAPAPPALTTLAARRVGPELTRAGTCCQKHTEPMSQFIALMNYLHRVVGNRPAYVASFRGGYPGLVYFVADLNPAPYTIELHTMVFTTQQRRAYMATFQKAVLPHTQAVLTSSLSAQEARIFLHRYPHARRITVMYAGAPYYVLLAN
jgi:hypothetical protein